MSESHEPVAAVSHDVSPEQVQQIKKHLDGYKKITITQVVFILVTVGASIVIRSTFAQVLVTLILAAANGTLVAGILMHLKEEKRTIWKFLIFTGVFFFILFFLTFLARTDPIMGTGHTHH
jgi:hypothetical protein